MAFPNEPGDFTDSKFNSSMEKYMDESNSPIVKRIYPLLDKIDAKTSKINEIEQLLNTYELNPGGFKGKRVVDELKVQLNVLTEEHELLTDELHNLYEQLKKEFIDNTNFVPGQKHGGMRHQFQKPHKRMF